MKCAIYRRVSTEMQSEDGYSLEAQKSRLLSYIESQGWELIEDYADEGVSAKNIERPALQRMLNDMRAGKFEVILVYRLDRLVRSVTDLHTLLNEFENAKVKFKSATEVFDTTSAMGRLFITMVGAMAQWERENLAERVTMGMLKRHEEGQRNGAKAPFGYDIGENGDLVINEDEAKWIRYIFESFKTKGRKMLAVELNKRGVKTKSGALFNDFALNYIVTNPVYYGALRWNYRKVDGSKTNEEVIVTGNHEPILSKELYDEVQKIRTARKGTGFKSDTHYHYTGILTCARCGKTMIGAKRKKKNGEYRFYRCRGRFTYGVCEMPIIPEDSIDEILISRFNFSELVAKIPKNTDSADNTDLLKQLEVIQKAKQKTFKAFQWDAISEVEFKEEMSELKSREEVIQSQLNTNENGDKKINEADIKSILENIFPNWGYVSYEEKKIILNSLFSYIKIEVTKEGKGGPGNRPEIEVTDYQLR